jgi:hypothetical protein
MRAGGGYRIVVRNSSLQMQWDSAVWGYGDHSMLVLQLRWGATRGGDEPSHDWVEISLSPLSPSRSRDSCLAISMRRHGGH